MQLSIERVRLEPLQSHISRGADLEPEQMPIWKCQGCSWEFGEYAYVFGDDPKAAPTFLSKHGGFCGDCILTEAFESIQDAGTQR